MIKKRLVPLLKVMRLRREIDDNVCMRSPDRTHRFHCFFELRDRAKLCHVLHFFGSGRALCKKKYAPDDALSALLRWVPQPESRKVVAH